MKKKSLKRVLAAALSVVMLMGITGCGSKENSGDSKAEPAADEANISGDLMLYTSEPEELVSDMIARFNETYPDVNIEVFRAGSGKVTAKMDAELATGSTEANLIWFADIGYMKNLDDQEMILHYDSPNAADVDAQYRYNDGMATEVRLIFNTIGYNTTEVANAPKDWNDVTSEEYKDAFAIADPNVSGGSFTALVSHVQNENLVGWDWYQAISDNGCKYEESNGNLQTKISSGEYKAAEIVDFMVRAAKADGSPVDVCYPESGAVLVPTPIAILNNTPEESVPAAKAFIDWLLSDEGQAMFVEQYYIPVKDSVAGPEGAPSASEIKTMPFDLEYFTANSAKIREEYTSRFGATQ